MAEGDVEISGCMDAVGRNDTVVSTLLVGFRWLLNIQDFERHAVVDALELLLCSGNERGRDIGEDIFEWNAMTLKMVNNIPRGTSSTCADFKDANVPPPVALVKALTR